MTTVALIADIHGNAWALERVLAELDRLDVDRIVCLGDIAVLGPEPALATQLLREIADIAVLGNVDAWLDPEFHPERAEPPTAIHSRRLRDWTRAQLTAGDLAWLTGLPKSARVDLGAGHILHAFHGSPTSCDAVLSAGMTDTCIEAAIGPSFQTPMILAGGHTHVPLLRSLTCGVLVNPGSVGLPGAGPGVPGLHRNTAVDWADFAILSTEPDQRPIVSFHRIDLDIAAMVDRARRSGMPEFDWWASLWR